MSEYKADMSSPEMSLGALGFSRGGYEAIRLATIVDTVRFPELRRTLG
jgi:hypothetical protein